MLKKFIFSIIFIILLSSAAGVYAHTFDGDKDRLGDNSGSLVDDLNRNLRKQEALRNKIKSAQDQEKSLKAQIISLNGQIELTQLEIEETENRLEQLSGDIDDVSLKLTQTKEDLTYSESVANSRIRNIYKQSYSSDLNSFLGSASFNDYLIRQKYTEIIREQDKALLAHLDDLKSEFSTQKLTLEEKQAKEEKLRAELSQKENDLASQESSKQYVLGVTKNNEQEYQRLLAQVQSEIAAIAQALGGGGVRLGPVRKGDVVAFQGNTGCSTGSHLHFGLYIGGGAVNPKPYLDSGALRWPLSNPTVTQWYGENYWWYMQNFGMAGHNGIDMVQYYGAPILAARDGVAYLATDGSACWLTGTVGKGIVIHHYNGWKTIYWHIQ